MVKGFRHFEDRGNYKFGCPEGTWRGRLDHRCWGKSSNLLLYFTNMDTQEKFWFSVYSNMDYTPRKGGPSFKTSVQEDDIFMLTTGMTSGGNPCLVAASPIASPEEDQTPAATPV